LIKSLEKKLQDGKNDIEKKEKIIEEGQKIKKETVNIKY
jgi:hypothetical protein